MARHIVEKALKEILKDIGYGYVQDISNELVKPLYSKFKRGFKKGGYGTLKIKKYSKKRKKYYKVKEKIKKTKIVIHSVKNFNFYHSSKNRKNVLTQ